MKKGFYSRQFKESKSFNIVEHIPTENDNKPTLFYELEIIVAFTKRKTQESNHKVNVQTKVLLYGW